MDVLFTQKDEDEFEATMRSLLSFSFSHSRGEVIAVVDVKLDVTLNFHSSQFSVFLDANVFEMRQLCHMCELS